MRRKTAAYPVRVKASPDMGEGIFEAVVAVFGNVDLVGDRIVKGAFAKSLEQWRDSGDPIPVIFNHDWGNLDAHVGYVLEAEERDEGLWVKAQLDMDEDYAQRLWKKMRRRTIKEMSFAYDVSDEGPAKDDEKVNELRELEVIEVGPTLKGANPATQLLEVKSEPDIEDDEEQEAVVVKMRPELDEEDMKRLAAFFIKSGRVLSAKNETKLREAHEIIGSVLASVEKEEQEEPKAVEESGRKNSPTLVLLELEELAIAVE